MSTECSAAIFENIDHDCLSLLLLMLLLWGFVQRITVVVGVDWEGLG